MHLLRAVVLFSVCSVARAFVAYGIEGKCMGAFCTDLELDFVRYEDLFRENKIILIPEDNGAAILAFKRYHAYDNLTGIYYFLASRPASGSRDGAQVTDYPPDVRLFVISVSNATLLNKVDVNSTVYQNITSMQFDSTTKTLYGVYENMLVVIDPLTGQQTPFAQMWDLDTTYLFNRIADYDSSTGRLFMSVHNYREDTYHIATYNTRTGLFVVSPPVGYDKMELSQSVPNGIAYNPNDGTVLLLTESRYGCGFERFFPDSQDWKDIVDANSPEMDNWDSYDYTKTYGSVYTFHAPSNRFFVSLLDASSGAAMEADMLQLDPVTLYLDQEWSTSTDFTNYVITENHVRRS